MGFFSEFKQFASRGNVVDLAVGVVIGGAFGKIVTSFVNDVLMPPIGLLMNDMPFKDLSLTLRAATGDKPAVMLNYGLFTQTIIDFLIIAFAVFLVVRLVNKLRKPAPEPVAPPPPEPTAEERLLTEIRDLLRNNPRA